MFQINAQLRRNQKVAINSCLNSKIPEYVNLLITQTM